MKAEATSQDKDPTEVFTLLDAIWTELQEQRAELATLRKTVEALTQAARSAQNPSERSEEKTKIATRTLRTKRRSRLRGDRNRSALSVEGIDLSVGIDGRPDLYCVAIVESGEVRLIEQKERQHA